MYSERLKSITLIQKSKLKPYWRDINGLLLHDWKKLLRLQTEIQEEPWISQQPEARWNYAYEHAKNLLQQEI